MILWTWWYWYKNRGQIGIETSETGIKMDDTGIKISDTGIKTSVRLRAQNWAKTLGAKWLLDIFF